MGITRDNYEQYFLDYTEGRLSPAGEKQLQDFLRANPDLAPLLREFDPGLTLAPGTLSYDRKPMLKRKIFPTAGIGEHNVDDMLIASAEGLPDESASSRLEAFLALNPVFRRDLELYRKTRLQPDLSVIFPRKRQLRKRGALVALFRPAWSLPAAAALILLFLAIRFLQQGPEATTGMESLVEGMESLPADDAMPREKPLPAPVAASQNTFAMKGTPSLSTGTPSRHSGTPSLRLPRNDRVELATPFTGDPPRPEAIKTSHPSAFSPKSTPLIARVARGFFHRSRQQVLENTRLDEISMPKLDLWTLAHAGIKGYNSMADREIELMVEKDEKGKASHYALIEGNSVILQKELSRD